MRLDRQEMGKAAIQRDVKGAWAFDMEGMMEGMGRSELGCGFSV